MLVNLDEKTLQAEYKNVNKRHSSRLSSLNSILLKTLFKRKPAWKVDFENLASRRKDWTRGTLSKFLFIDYLTAVRIQISPSQCFFSEEVHGRFHLVDRGPPKSSHEK